MSCPLLPGRANECARALTCLHTAQQFPPGSLTCNWTPGRGFRHIRADSFASTRDAGSTSHTVCVEASRLLHAYHLHNQPRTNVCDGDALHGLSLQEDILCANRKCTDRCISLWGQRVASGKHRYRNHGKSWQTVHVRFSYSSCNCIPCRSDVARPGCALDSNCFPCGGSTNMLRTHVPRKLKCNLCDAWRRHVLPVVARPCK